MNQDDIYFTSDSHFSHKKICEYSRRPFATIEDHNEGLIENWNRVVSPGGVVYHLGDLFLCNQEEAKKIRERLNGQICLITGNHDKTANSAACEKLFTWRKAEYMLKVKDSDAHDGVQNIHLYHCPIESWYKKRFGGWHLHGHSHGAISSSSEQLRLDVGVDSWASFCRTLWAALGGYGDIRNMYCPISYSQVKAHMQTKSFKPNFEEGREFDAA